MSPTPYREQPTDFVAGPPRYPTPDLDAIGTVARVYVPDDETVGYLVFQGGTALAWFSDVDPDHLGYPIRRHVSDILRAGARIGVPAETAWAQVLADTLHEPPVDDFLPALLADLRAKWNPPQE